MRKFSFEEKLIVLQSVTSTNNYAISIIAEKHPPEGTIIWALEQTSGKGTGENKWHSEPLKNLTFSIILYPKFLHIENEFFISKIISLAVTDFMINFINNVKIKWPNDIYINDSKIGGLLIENLISNGIITTSVIGIGLNINQTAFPPDLQNACSLIQFKKYEYDLNLMLKQLYYCIIDRYEQLKRQEFNEITYEYLKRIYRMNFESRFISNGKEFNGRIVNIENDGKLVVFDENGHYKKFNFKEIEFVIKFL
jgi:BirA family biotin operon repressor/biotin-[acetyl-CoA-carboxylase] ligase